MATGKPPWSEVSNNVTVMFHIASAKGPPLIPSTLSPEAQDFLRLCFDRDPKQRPNATRLLKHPFVVNVRHSATAVASSVPALAPQIISTDKSSPPQYTSHDPLYAASNSTSGSENCCDIVSDTDVKVDVVECSEGSIPQEMEQLDEELGSCQMPEPLEVFIDDNTVSSSVEGASSTLESFVNIVKKRAIVDTLRLSQPFIHGSLAESEIENREANVLEKQQQWADDLKVELERMKEHCMAMTTSAT